MALYLLHSLITFSSNAFGVSLIILLKSLNILSECMDFSANLTIIFSFVTYFLISRSCFEKGILTGHTISQLSHKVQANGKSLYSSLSTSGARSEPMGPGIT